MRSLPRIVSQIPSDLRNFLDRVREYLGEGGETRFVTLRELRAGGIVSTTPNGTITEPTATDAENPNMPTGLVTSSVLAGVLLSWDAPTYQGHGYTEIWAAAVDDINSAAIVGTANGTTFTHNLGGNATNYYWIRFINKYGVFGPYNSDVGTVGTAGDDPAYLLEVLAGSITDAELSAALNTQIDTNTTQITDVRNLYTVKMDNQGYLTGFGLMSTLSEGGAPTTDFFVNANRFAVTTPTTSIPARADSTAYTAGAFVSVASSTSKMLVCKTGGTTSTTAPNIASTSIGTLVTDDGTVVWQVASRVPLSVLTTSATINGVSVSPGVYIDGATIVNATITTAAIGNAAITDAKINDLSATKITAGNIQTGYIRSTTYTVGATGWSINADGSANFHGNLAAGNATAFSTGTGFFSGFISTTYKWRVGNPSGARIEWDGSAVYIYAPDGSVTLASGGIDYSKVTGTKPPADADKTSLNTAAAIANQGIFATAGQLTASGTYPASTYIAGLALNTPQFAYDSATVFDVFTIPTTILSVPAASAYSSATTTLLASITGPATDVSTQRVLLVSLKFSHTDSSPGWFEINFPGRTFVQDVPVRLVDGSSISNFVYICPVSIAAGTTSIGSITLTLKNGGTSSSWWYTSGGNPDCQGNVVLLTRKR